MKKLDGWQYPLALLFVVVCASGFALYPPVTSSDVATWVGAVGTIAAIGGAVWVANHQYERTRQDDLDETKAFVSAVVEELTTIWKGYSSDTRVKLLAVENGEFFAYIYPVSSDAFTIYNNASARVGKVTDKELRRLIVHVYAQAKGIIASYQLNNENLRDMAKQLGLGELGMIRFEQLRAEMIPYARSMKARDAMLASDLKAMFKQAEVYLKV